MSVSTRPRDWLSAAVILAIVAAGCGGDRSGGPAGSPEDIVARAPDLTLAARTARVLIYAPAAEARGVVDLVARSAQLSMTDLPLAQPAELIIEGGRGYAKRSSDAEWTSIAGTLPWSLSGGDPFSNLDLLRGTVHILSDGGAEVDGASTLRYTLTVDPGLALATTPPERRGALRGVLQGRTAQFMMDVWIDSKLLIRRIEVATNLKPTTLSTRADRMPIATDVDYVSFGVPVGPIRQPPAP